MPLRGLDLLGVPIADEQARAFGFVLIGVLAAIILLTIGRRARRLVIGLAITGALLVGLALAVRAGMLPDPRSLVPGLAS